MTVMPLEVWIICAAGQITRAVFLFFFHDMRFRGFQPYSVCTICIWRKCKLEVLPKLIFQCRFLSPLTWFACSTLSFIFGVFPHITVFLFCFFIGGNVKWRGKMEVHSNNRCNFNASVYLLGHVCAPCNVRRRDWWGWFFVKIFST